MKKKLIWVGIFVSVYVLFVGGYSMGIQHGNIQTRTVNETQTVNDTTDVKKLNDIDNHIIERQNALIYQQSLPDGDLTNSQAADKALLIENIRKDIDSSVQSRTDLLKQLGM